MSDVVKISEWLKTLRDAAPSIQNAGAQAGAARAQEQGFTAQSDGTTVYVNFRGRKPIRGVPQAMGEGMLVEFERRKR